jgi:hypothetical protein
VQQQLSLVSLPTAVLYQSNVAAVDEVPVEQLLS